MSHIRSFNLFKFFNIRKEFFNVQYQKWGIGDTFTNQILTSDHIWTRNLSSASINQSINHQSHMFILKYLNSVDFYTIGIFSNAFVWFSKCICCGLNSLGWPLWRQLCSKVLLAGKKCLQQNFLTLMAQRVEFVKNWKYDSWKVWIVLWLCWVKSSNPIKDP